MSKCIFDDTGNGGSSVTLDMNPSTDTGWVAKVVYTTQHAPNASVDVIQIGGLNSQVRKMEGVTKSRTIQQALEAMKSHVISFTDQRGTNYSAFVADIQWTELNDITNLPLSSTVGTFKWVIDLIKR